jgi:hypothetical protein
MTIALVVTPPIMSTTVLRRGPLQAPAVVLGPVRVESLLLNLDDVVVAEKDAFGDRVYSANVPWKDSELQALVGRVEVTAVVSHQIRPAWRRADSTCAYVTDHYASVDESPARTLVNVAIALCPTYNTSQGRLFQHMVENTTPACQAQAIVFARVPWLYDSELPERLLVNERLQRHEVEVARVLSAADLLPAANCRSASLRATATIIATALALVFGTLVLVLVVRTKTISVVMSASDPH